MYKYIFDFILGMLCLWGFLLKHSFISVYNIKMGILSPCTYVIFQWFYWECVSIWWKFISENGRVPTRSQIVHEIKGYDFWRKQKYPLLVGFELDARCAGAFRFNWQQYSFFLFCFTNALCALSVIEACNYLFVDFACKCFFFSVRRCCLFT